MFSSRLRRARRGEFGPRLSLQFLEERVTPTTFVVSNLLDGAVTKAGDLPGSLRQAIFDANANPGADVVDATGVSGTIVLAGGEIKIGDPVSIVGPGADLLSINANKLSRVVSFSSTVSTIDESYSISKIEIQGGLVSTTQGAGIYCSIANGKLVLDSIRVTGNTSYTDGGGIALIGGNLTASNSTITLNSVSRAGGGLFASGKGQLSLTNVSITSNKTLGSGNGAGLSTQISTQLTACLISDNLMPQGGYGAGIYSSTSLAMQNVEVRGNWIDYPPPYYFTSGGGGVYSMGYLEAHSCVIAANKMTIYGGGGIYATSTTRLFNCVITENESNDPVSGGGGGIIAQSSDLLIDNCTISKNTAIANAGGVIVGGIIRQTTISNNAATTSGGGLLVQQANLLTITNSTVSNNSAGMDGGGLYLIGPGARVLQNCTITANQGTTGGGIYTTSSINLDSSIVSDNFATTASPDIFSTAEVVSTNSNIGDIGGIPLVTRFGHFVIGSAKLGPLADNGGPTWTRLPLPDSPIRNLGTTPSQLEFDQRGLPRLQGIAIDIGAVESPSTAPDSFVSADNILAPGASQHTFTVTYFDPDGIDISKLIGNSNAVRVIGPNGFSAPAEYVSIDDKSNGSPRVVTYQVIAPGGFFDPSDGGFYSVEIQPNQVFDLTGQTAPAGPRGCFEVLIPWTFVVSNDLDGTVTKAGDLPGSLRQAIFDANRWPTADSIVFDPQFFAVPRTITLAKGQLVSKGPVTITGPGAGLLTIDAHETSRAISITELGQNRAAFLQGITFTRGRTYDQQGGAIYSSKMSLTLTDCVISGSSILYSSTTRGGGGIYCAGNLTLENCSIVNNSCQTIGGGIYVTGAAEQFIVRNSNISNNTSYYDGGGTLSLARSLVILENTVISNNKATGFKVSSYEGGGGASIRPSAGNVSILGCTIVGNVTSAIGGGCLVITSGSFTIQNTTLSNNIAAKQGGGLWLIAGDAQLENVTIDKNSSYSTTAYEGGGGGVFFRYPMPTTIQNCVVTGNESKTSGGGICFYSAAYGSITDCTISGNSARSNGGGLYFGNGGSLVVSNTAITNNSTTGSKAFGVYGGGGVYITRSVTENGLSFRNTTISGNSTKVNGGGILLAAATGTLSLRNCTISQNSAISGGGGLARIDAYSGNSTIDIVLVSSIVASNVNAATPDISTTGTVTADHSLIGVTNGITTLTATASLTGTLAAPLDPLLAPLADNGGPTKTHVPMPGSPAINRGSNPLNLTYDQRGPGYPRQAGVAPDIGAFEFPLPPVVNAFTVDDGSQQRSMIRSVTVTFSEAVTFPFGPAAAFQLQRTGPGGPTGLVNLAFSQVGNVVTVTFDDSVLAPAPGKSLIDGNYSLTLMASKIQGAAGLLDGNGDGIPGGNVSTTFHRLFGDSNGDRKVTAIDYNAFRIAWATSNTTFDFNNDGIITAADFSQFRLRYGVMV